MEVLKETEVSLTGYSYRICFLAGSSQPYSVECNNNGELYEVDYFKNRATALKFFGDSSIGLDLIKG